MRGSIHLVTSLYLATSILLGAGPGVVVLCVASDGHLAIEAGGARCVDYSATAQSSAFGFMASADCCGPCVDLPLGSAALREGCPIMPGTASVIAAPGLLATVCVSPSAVPSGTAFQPGGRARPPTAFPPTRTTILRN